MAKQPDFELDADEIIGAAVEIFREHGLDAVSMRNVASRLGVSPVPLYSRVGNKGALVDAIADRLLADLAPPTTGDEPWTAYAARWAGELRARLHQASDSRLILPPRREAYVAASLPLVATMQAGGLAADAAVRACRLLMWAVVGFVAIEAGVRPPPPGRRRRARPGGDPGGVTPPEADELFRLQIRYLIDGLARDGATEGTP